MARVAVIGLGYWGPNLVRNFSFRLGEDLRVCCDQSTARTQLIAKNYPAIHTVNDPELVFRDPEIDAVAIATPVETHFNLAKRALLAGKSVLVEKPLAGSVEQAEELVDLAARKGLVLMVDHVFVHNHAVQKIKELIDSGYLGNILYFDSVRINLGKIQDTVNVVWDLAPHDLSIVDHLVGRPPVSVSAFGASHTVPGLEDVAYLNLDYGENLIANFHLNWLSPIKVRYTIVGGSNRSLVYNDLHPAELVKVYDSRVNVRSDDYNDRRRLQIDYQTGEIWSPHIPPCEPLQNVVSDFVRCVDQGDRPLTDGHAGLRIVRILEAAQRSIADGGTRVSLNTGARSPAPLTATSELTAASIPQRS